MIRSIARGVWVCVLSNGLLGVLDMLGMLVLVHIFNCFQLVCEGTGIHPAARAADSDRTSRPALAASSAQITQRILPPCLTFFLHRSPGNGS